MHTLNDEIRTRTDGFDIVELIERSTASSVSICPARGGIVLSCILRGTELLYLDRDTFLDPAANIRGGIPVLFPICGQLIEGQYEWNGSVYKMNNHGVARTAAWNVVAQGTDDGVYATLEMSSNEETLAAYPFAFRLRFTYRLKDGKLAIEQQYVNDSGEAMPVVAGFHPYFVAGDKHLSYDTDARSHLDYNDGIVKPFGGSLDLTSMKESAALLDAVRSEIAFPLAGGEVVRLSYSTAFRYVVLWSVAGKPFICVEPWTALNEALNHKEGLIMVQPGETLALELVLARD